MILPPIWFILHDLPDDLRRTPDSPTLPSYRRRHRPQMLNFLDSNASPDLLPRIRDSNTGTAHDLPPLRDFLGDQLDRYRLPSYSTPDGRDREVATFRSSMNEREEYHERPESRDDVDRWVQSTSPNIQTSGTSHSSTPAHSGYSRDTDPVYSNDLSASARYPLYNQTFDDEQPLQPQTNSNQDRQVIPRTRWQMVIIEAGGLGAALSEESMRKLRYVLQWLQYATNHIDQQILTIRDFTESLQQQYFDPSAADGSPTTPTRNNPSGNTSGHSQSSSTSAHSDSRSCSESQSQAISSTHMHKLNSLRRDVVHTVREVVGVVSKHGGDAALPEPARNAVRGFILTLPRKVADAMRMGGPSADITAGSGSVGSVSGTERDSVAAAASGRAGSDRRANSRRLRGDRGVGGSTTASPVASRATSPTASPRLYQSRSLHSATSSTSEDQRTSGQGPSSPHTMSAGTAVIAAQRILTLATESLDMMHGVTGVVMDSLDRADAWIDRLRMVGVQRGNGSSDDPSSPGTDRGQMNLNLSPSMQYRDQDSDSTLPSPLGTTPDLGRSRGGSVGSSTGYSYVSGSVPSTPGLSSHPYGYDGNTDASSPEVGQGLRRMNIQGDEDEMPVKNEEQEMVKMEVDA